MNRQSGESLVGLMVALAIGGIVTAVVATWLVRSGQSSRSAEAVIDLVALRQELRNTVDCRKTLESQACDSASAKFPLLNSKGKVIGKPRTGFWQLGIWGLRASCEGDEPARTITIEVRQTTTDGKPAKDPLTGKLQVFAPLFPPGAAGLKCSGDPQGSCPVQLVGPDHYKLCSTPVSCAVVKQPGAGPDGPFGCFAPCSPGEMPYACGFHAQSAFTKGATWARPETRGGVPGCECTIGEIERCTGGTSKATGCSSMCRGTCIRVIQVEE